MATKIKSEHNGAKNGGGHWGKRTEAKNISRKVRRLDNKHHTREESKRSKSSKTK